MNNRYLNLIRTFIHLYQYSVRSYEKDFRRNNAGNHHEDGIQRGFYFKPRREKLNWRVINQIDSNKIMDEVDIDTLESITKNLAFARIDLNGLFVVYILINYRVQIYDILQRKTLSIFLDCRN